MSKKNFLIVTILTVFLGASIITNAQENPTEKEKYQDDDAG